MQAPSPGAVAAFEREVTFLRALEHPAIPRFVASFEEGSGVHTRYYLAQELVDGTALDRLDEKGFVRSKQGEATRERGGRRKLYFMLTAPGKRALTDSMNAMGSLRRAAGWQEALA